MSDNIKHIRELIRPFYNKAEIEEFLEALEGELSEKDKQIDDLEDMEDPAIAVDPDEDHDPDEYEPEYEVEELGLDTIYFEFMSGNLAIRDSFDAWVKQTRGY